ncbi:MAG: LysM domain-containing protein [Spirochaetes bacterium]|nr:MAG: LysM domain-containing protein [Spirochaetota bacterium]
MKLAEFIERAADRLFILDNECHVIFTGDSLTDERPFIRIGNWMNLPVEIIPLIENIIITDSMTGNPAHEQFNIDVTLLSSNRYIGSSSVVKRYLEFQKSFGLDLKNASIVDIEKDIPSVSREKIISDRDSYIGIFYSDGNFRVTHNRAKIFDGKEMAERHYSDQRIHDLLSLHAKDGARYAGSGMVLLKNNPLFYRNRYFTSYHFPRTWYEDFSALSIDPARIREILLPSENIMNVAKLMKWKHFSRGRIRIFSDSKENMDLLQKLFSGATIVRNPFKGFEHDTGDGLHIRNYADSFNVRLTYRKVRPSSADLVLAYVKGRGGVREIVRDGIDGLLVHYPVYQDMNVALKSAHKPVLVLTDPGTPFARLKGAEVTLVRPGVQYEFMKYEDAPALVADITAAVGSDTLTEPVRDRRFDELPGLAKTTLASGDAAAGLQVFNLIGLLRAVAATASERALSGGAKKALAEIEHAFDRESFFAAEGARLAVTCAFHAGGVAEFAAPAQGAGKEYFIPDDVRDGEGESLARVNDRDMAAFYETIRRDRARLMELLALLKPAAGIPDVQELRGAIDRKKEEFRDDAFGASDVDKAIREQAKPRAGRFFTPRRIIAACLVLGLGIVALGVARHMGGRTGKPAEQEAREERARLIAKYRISLNEKEIFDCANQVAIGNGFAPLIYPGVKVKNPHWIFPGNRFEMADGTVVTVREGDTLWGISQRWLMDASIKFNQALDPILDGIAAGRNVDEGIERLKGLAVTASQKAKVRELAGTGK